jgi:cytidylate kinase
MGIIIITKGSYCSGRVIAETLGEKLGYDCVSREIILAASEQFNVPEIKLVRALENAPSFLDRITSGKEKYIAYFRSAFLKRLQKDNIIYHGFAGHFFTKDVANVFKVQIIANLEYRVRNVMNQEDIAPEEARKLIENIDAARSKWSRYLYGIDSWNPNFYDMVLRIDNMTLENVVDTMVNTVQLPCFQISSESKSILNDLALEAEVRANLVEKFPASYVSAKDKIVTVIVQTTLADRERAGSELEKILKGVDGAKDFEIRVEVIQEDKLAKLKKGDYPFT